MNSMTRSGPIRFDPVAGGLALTSPYNVELVAAIKALPYSGRKWDQPSKRWIIDPAHAVAVADLVQTLFGVTVAIPAPIAPAAPSVRVVRLDYLGVCKDRGDGPATATGFADGAWSLLFPEPVLRAWFQDELEAPAPAGQPQPQPKPKTLYAELAVKKDADAAEIKSAFRRLARQWHPDQCKEANAVERFQRIKQAYDVLSDDKLRKRYNAGLILAGKVEAAERASERYQAKRAAMLASYQPGYRAPLRCGLLVLIGQQRVSGWAVSGIIAWDDITNDQGQTLVASWPSDGDMFVQEWV